MKSTILLMKFLLATLLMALGPVSHLQAQSSGTDKALSLSEAVQLAIRTAPSMRIAQAQLDAAKEHVQEIDSYAYPQLGGDANYTRIDPVVSLSIPEPNGQSQTFSTMPNNNYSASLGIQQLITAFGRETANERVAESGIKTAEDNFDQYRATTAYQTVQTYYAILSTDESIRVEQDQMKVLQSNLSVTEEREKQGTATVLDPLNIRVRVSAIQNQIADLNATRRKQEAILHRLTGIAPGTHISVTRPAAGSSLPEGLGALDTVAEKHRPEIITALDAENTARLQIEAARLSNNPTLSANVVGGVKDGYLPDLTKPTLNWAGTLSIHVPIYDGGRTRSQVDQAEANLRIAQARTDDARRGVRNDIEQALADLDASRLRLDQTKVQIEQAQQAYDVANVRYQNGVATELDLLTAQAALEQANLQQAQLTYQLELSQYNLNRAVGTLMW